MIFTDEQIEEIEGVYIEAWDDGKIGGQLRGIRAVAEHVAALSEARIAELERQIELAQRLRAVEVRAKEARIAELAAECHQWEEFAEHNGLRLAPETAAEDVQALRNRIATLTTACEAALKAIEPIHSQGNMSLTVACIRLRAALEEK